MEVQTEAPIELNRFVQVCLNGKVLDEYELRSSVLSIGRSPECDIVIDNVAVSSFHAILSQRNGKLFVEDAASTNGVMADGVKLSDVELAPGESVQIVGKYSLRLLNAPTRTPSEKKAKTVEPIQAETMVVCTSALARASQQIRPAYLTLSQAGRSSWIVRIEKSSLSIGAKRSSDIRVGGWLSPTELASIERRDDGFYLISVKAGTVSVDGETIHGDCRLADGQRIQFGRLSAVFHERTNRNGR